MRSVTLATQVLFLFAVTLAACEAPRPPKSIVVADERQQPPIRMSETGALAAQGDAVAAGGRDLVAIFEKAMQVHERSERASRCRDYGASFRYKLEAGRMLRPLADQLRRLAEQGDTKSQYMLGKMYANGLGVEIKDYAEGGKEARKWYRRAADQGHADAEFWLGFDYYFARDYAEAMALFRKAAEKGNASAQSYLGLMHYRGEGVAQDYKEAAQWFRKAAEQGEALAQHLLAVMYDDGLGVKQDYAQAVEWYRKAAVQGSTESQISLGEAYVSGRGISQDYSAAAGWFRGAAQEGYVHAQFNLGLLYYGGRGVPQDYVEAHKWFNLAASRHASGQQAQLYASLRDDVAKRMTPDQIAEAQRLAREWKSKPPLFGCKSQ